MFKVSIIIPIFNVKDYLRRALDSILNQTMEINDIQVIMVDDKSTDGSDLIAEEYSNKYDNFSLYKLNQNSGSASKPRNVGLKYVESEYVMFLDPDDEYSQDYCEVMYSAIKKYDVDLVKCNFITVNTKGVSKNYNFDPNINEKIINCGDEPLKVVSICNGIHNYNFLVQNDINFIEECFGEDIFFSVKEHLCMNKLIFLNNYFEYIYHDKNSSHAKTPSVENIMKILKVFYLTRDLCKSYHRDDIINIVLGYQIIGIYIRIRNVKGWDNKLVILKEVRNFLKTTPNLIVPNTIYKITNTLLRKGLFNLTIFYLNIINTLSKSKFLQKLISFL